MRLGLRDCLPVPRDIQREYGVSMPALALYRFDTTSTNRHKKKVAVAVRPYLISEPLGIVKFLEIAVFRERKLVLAS